MPRTRWIGSAAIAALLVMLPASVQARPITLAWDPNPEPDVAGYVIVYGTQSGVYTNSLDVGNVATYQLDLPGVQYYFAVRAYSTSGANSPLSAEVADSSAIVLVNTGDQSGRAGFGASLQIMATGSSLSYAATNLPAGLSINASTGLINGTIGAGAAASSPYFVSVSVSDGSGDTTSLQFTWTVAVNHAPSLTNPGNQTSAQNATASLQLSASDADGDALTYSVTGLPPSLTVNAATGLISGMLSSASAGVHTVIATASDGSLTNSQTFTWTVTGPAGALAVDAVVFSDGNGTRTTAPFSTIAAGETVLAFVASSGPTTGGQTATVTGAGLTWTLLKRTNAQTGTAEIWKAIAAGVLSSVTVTSTPGMAGYSQSLTVITFTGAGGTGAAGGASGPNGAPSVSLTSTQAGSVVYAVGNDWDAAVARTLGANQTMTHEWDDTTHSNTFWVQHTSGPVPVAGTVVTLNDTAPTGDRWNFAAVEVVPVSGNHPPSLTNPGNMTTAENTAVSLQLVATDPDGDVLTYSATNLPSALAVNPTTGLISGTLTYSSAGVYAVTVAASDGSLSDSKTLTWTVTNVDRAPTITPPGNQTSGANAPATLAIVASDPDGDPLTYSAAGLPAGLTMNLHSGVIGGTVGSVLGTYPVTVTVSDGSMTASAAFMWRVTLTGRSSASSDLDGDGRSDVVWRNKVTGQNIAWLMNGSAVSLATFLATISDVNWEVKGTGDFDGDGRADVLWRNKATGQNIIWLMNGTSITKAFFAPTIADLTWDISGIGDFDGDGKADIVWRNRVTGQNIIWLMNGGSTASTTIGTAAFIVTIPDVNWEIKGVGDMDGDGRADIIWRNKVTGQNIIWLMNGLTVATAVFGPTVADLNWEIRGVGDTDGDGRVDVLWRNKATGANLIWLMNGTSVAMSALLSPIADLTWDIAGIGDYNGDGKADIVWRNNTTGQNVLWLMNGTLVMGSSFLPTIADPNWEIVSR